MCSAGLPGCVEFNASTVALRFEYLRTEPAVQEVDVWCNIPADFWWPHLRDFLSDSWPSARVIKSDDVGGWSSFGSGSFGKWGGDEFGLPRYTLAQPAPGKPLPKALDIAALNGGHLHQVGNDRMVAMAMTDGSVQMRQDEGGKAATMHPSMSNLASIHVPESCLRTGAKFLNSHSANLSHGQHGGAVGYLSEAGSLLLSTVSANSSGAERIEMELGVGYFRKRLKARELTVEHTVVAPHGDHPFALIVVNVTNHASSPRKLKWVEVWGRLMRELIGARNAISGHGSAGGPDEAKISAADFAQRITHRIRRTGAGDAAPGLLDEVVPPTGGPPKPPAGSLFPAASAHDYDPRPAFLRVIDGGSNPTRVGCDGRALFPDGAGVDRPDLASGLQCDESAILGPEALLALEMTVDVGGSASAVRLMAFGYHPEGNSSGAAVPASFVGQDAAAAAWPESSKLWRQESVTVSVPGQDWLERETIWHSYALRAGLTHDSFWGGSVLQQAGIRMITGI